MSEQYSFSFQLTKELFSKGYKKFLTPVNKGIIGAIVLGLVANIYLISSVLLELGIGWQVFAAIGIILLELCLLFSYVINYNKLKSRHFFSLGEIGSIFNITFEEEKITCICGEKYLTFNYNDITAVRENDNLIFIKFGDLSLFIPRNSLLNYDIMSFRLFLASKHPYDEQAKRPLQNSLALILIYAFIFVPLFLFPETVVSADSYSIDNVVASFAEDDFKATEIIHIIKANDKKALAFIYYGDSDFINAYEISGSRFFRSSVYKAGIDLNYYAELSESAEKIFISHEFIFNNTEIKFGCMYYDDFKASFVRQNYETVFFSENGRNYLLYYKSTPIEKEQ